MSENNSEEITLEIRYGHDTASELYLMWGINGWQPVPVEKQPPGTIITEQGKMKSPMEFEGDRFVIRLKLPARAEFNYAFVAAGPGVPGSWENLTSRDNIIDIYPLDTRPKRKQEQVYGYSRFILLGRGRSGSSFLMALLESHPNIKSFGELFHNDSQERIKHSKDAPAIDRQDNPVEYLENHIFIPYPPHIQAVGFKLFYWHAGAGRWRKVWDYLQHPELKVIHLERRNMLNQYLSHRLAARSEVWATPHHKPDRNVTYNQPLELDPADCIKKMSIMFKERQEINTLFPANPRLEVVYEDLVADQPAEIRRILEFLGLEFRELQSPLVKQRRKKKTDLISNYAELKQAFIDGLATGQTRAEWLEFFDDE